MEREVCEYFIASDNEFSKVENIVDILWLSIDKYKVGAGYGGFEMTKALSRLFFQDELHIPKKVEKKILGIKNVYQYEQDFVSTIALVKRDEINDFAYFLREDKYCVSNNFVGMGLWNFLYELHNCCTLAFEKDLNLYLLIEDIQYISDDFEISK